MKRLTHYRHWAFCCVLMIIFSFVFQLNPSSLSALRAHEKGKKGRELSKKGSSCDCDCDNFIQGPPGPPGPTGPPGPGGGGCCLTFRWGFQNNDALIANEPWEGDDTATNSITQTFHLYDASNADPVTVEAIILIKSTMQNPTTYELHIQEVVPADFNDPPAIPANMNITLNSVVGQDTATVGQGDATTIEVTQGTDGNDFEVIKITFTATPTTNCSIWHWYETNEGPPVNQNNNEFYLFNVKVLAP